MDITPEVILFILEVAALNLFIIYQIIKHAVSSATSELNTNIAILVRLKYLEMKKQGVSYEEMKKEVDFVYQPQEAQR